MPWIKQALKTSQYTVMWHTRKNEKASIFTEKATLTKNTSQPKTNQHSTLLLGQSIFYSSIQYYGGAASGVCFQVTNPNSVQLKLSFFHSIQFRSCGQGSMFLRDNFPDQMAAFLLFHSTWQTDTKLNRQRNLQKTVQIYRNQYIQVLEISSNPQRQARKQKILQINLNLANT